MEKLTRLAFNLLSRLQLVALFMLLVFSLASCAGLSFLQEPGGGGVYHRVKRGETLSEIARAYNMDLQSLAEANNITNPSLIEEDSVLFIPNAQSVIDEIEIAARGKRKDDTISREATAKKSGNGEGKLPDKLKYSQKVPPDKTKPAAGGTLREETISPSSESAKAVTTGADSSELSGNEGRNKSLLQLPNGEKQEERPVNKNIFIWPLKGKVIAFFGKQPNGMFFNGIRIAAPADTAVLSAGDGTVIHSEFLKYYGETIIIQHKDEYATVYAGLGRRTVSVNSHLKKGDRIGFTGRDVQKEEMPLYFETRRKNKAINPLALLP